MEEEMRFHSKSKNFTHTFGVSYSKEQVMTSRKLYGKDLSEYEDVDVEDLLTQLTPEEIEILSKEVDPDWIPPEIPKVKARDDDIGTFDLGDEYEKALNHASEEELVDLAAILGFHSMMNQDQYHASLLNKEKVGLGWDGVTKASRPKPGPVDPPNMTDPEDSIKRLDEDDSKLIALNWNNLNIKDDQFERLFKALEENTRLEILSMSNTGMTDHQAESLAQSLEKNQSLRILNIESNLLSGKGIIRLLKAMLAQNMIEEFRASNQRTQVLGNPTEMEITQLVEKNSSLLRLGLHLEYNDARSRVAAQLQRNIDRKRTSVSVSVRIKTSKKTVVYEESESACFTLGSDPGMVVVEESPEVTPGQVPEPGL